MHGSIPMIGLSADEIPWVRKLVGLLRHSDPTVRELARQALLYVSQAACHFAPAQHAGPGSPQSPSMLQFMK